MEIIMARTRMRRVTRTTKKTHRFSRIISGTAARSPATVSESGGQSSLHLFHGPQVRELIRVEELQLTRQPAFEPRSRKTSAALARATPASNVCGLCLTRAMLVVLRAARASALSKAIIVYVQVVNVQ